MDASRVAEFETLFENDSWVASSERIMRVCQNQSFDRTGSACVCRLQSRHESCCERLLEVGHRDLNRHHLGANAKEDVISICVVATIASVGDLNTGALFVLQYGLGTKTPSPALQTL